jgi:hypothetical protein
MQREIRLLYTPPSTKQFIITGWKTKNELGAHS